jgi:hypothetical protein
LFGVSYREDDFASVGDAPDGFGVESDELIFSDHYDENPASAVELVADVKLWLDNGKSSVPKLPRDGRHFVCRHVWLKNEKRLLDLAVASVLDAGDQSRQRSMHVLRSLLKKSLGSKIPSSYEDPAGPFDDEIAQKEKGRRGSKKRKADDADDEKKKSKSADEKKAKKTPDKTSGGKKKATAAADGDENDDDGADGNDDDDGGETAAEKKAAKKANTRRMPTYEEAEQLLLSRGELAVLSSTKAFSEVIGGLVLLKHKDDHGVAQTTLLEIEKLPDVDAPYRPYPITYIAPDGHTETLPDCVAGIELVMNSDSEASRRSLVNVRDRAIDRISYDEWIATRNPKSRYPATEKEIKALINRIEAARKQHTRGKVKAPDSQAAK